MTLPPRIKDWFSLPVIVIAGGLAAVLCLSLYPKADLAVSGLFFDSLAGNFPARMAWPFDMLHEGVQTGSRVIGVIFALGLVVSLLPRHRWLRSMGTWRVWAFLLVSLLLGPGLVANVALKDQWGRARPVQVEEFGGTAQFTPALLPSAQCDTNCSFVAGDPAFGFWLVAFAFVASPLRARRLFWMGMLAGFGLGLMRVAMGAHFASDALAAGVVIPITVALTYRIFFGQRLFEERGRLFARGPSQPVLVA
ncbi:MAG: phosphatase PAP2 family protein [Alphaproteobacteria bacterium]|nr:MAG: phosphatase PAP2 family protein [Alphaproteobacteria bacterium]